MTYSWWKTRFRTPRITGWANTPACVDGHHLGVDLPAAVAAHEADPPGDELVAPATQDPAVPHLQLGVVDGLDDLGGRPQRGEQGRQFFGLHVSTFPLVASSCFN